mgnify:CR=1 FL=1
MTAPLPYTRAANLPALLRATYPCGSITGAPKLHTMGLIRRFESTPRGLYCGAIGWLDDYLKISRRNPKGLAARKKYFWQSVAALAAARRYLRDVY